MAGVVYGGCRLAYRVRGNLAGPRVVMIQGVGLHGDGWLPQVEGAVGKACACLTFDNRGMGESQAVAGGRRHGAEITVEQMAQDTLAVMDAAGWEDAHLVGHSLGGLVALEMALASRRRVQSLVLACSFADGRVATALTLRMLWLGTRARLGPRSWRRSAFLEMIMPAKALKGEDRQALAGRLAPVFGHDLTDMPPVVADQLRALKHYDATRRLGELAGVPVLVISAGHDPIARPARGGRVLAEGIPGARYLEFPDASHGLPIQFAAVFSRAVLEHVMMEPCCREAASGS